MTTLHFTEVQRDCLQELVNVAMGQASDKLARYLTTMVHLQVPAIKLVDTQQLPQHFAQRYQQQSVSLISMGFFGDQGLRGEDVDRQRLGQGDDIGLHAGNLTGEHRIAQPPEAEDQQLACRDAPVLGGEFGDGRLGRQLQRRFGSARQRAGDRERIVAFACVGPNPGPLRPCGRCRQLLHEHGGAAILIDHADGPVPLGALIPEAFGPEAIP